MDDATRLMTVGQYRVRMPFLARLALIELADMEGRDESEVLTDLIRDALRRRFVEGAIAHHDEPEVNREAA